MRPFCKGRPSSGTFRAATSPHQFARSVQSHLPIWQWLRRLLRVSQAAEQGAMRKMDGQAPSRATTVDPWLCGFSRYALLRDQHLPIRYELLRRQQNLRNSAELKWSRIHLLGPPPNRALASYGARMRPTPTQDRA